MKSVLPHKGPHYTWTDGRQVLSCPICIENKRTQGQLAHLEKNRETRSRVNHRPRAPKRYSANRMGDVRFAQPRNERLNANGFPA